MVILSRSARSARLVPYYDLARPKNQFVKPTGALNIKDIVRLLKKRISLFDVTAWIP